jgi:hypothetical protein
VAPKFRVEIIQKNIEYPRSNKKGAPRQDEFQLSVIFVKRLGKSRFYFQIENNNKTLVHPGLHTFGSDFPK